MPDGNSMAAGQLCNLSEPFSPEEFMGLRWALREYKGRCFGNDDVLHIRRGQ